MRASWQLWVTALLLGAWIGIGRIFSQAERFPTWPSRIGAFMQSESAAILTLLFCWVRLEDQPALLLFGGMVAAFFGPELPRILPILLRRLIDMPKEK